MINLYSMSVFVGAVALTVGLLLLFAPSLLKRLNDLSAKMVARVDSLTFTYRIGYGVSLLIVAGFMFFMAYYFTKRYR